MSSGRKKPVSRANKAGMVVITTIVCLLIAVLLFQSYGLKKRIVAYAATNEQLEEQIRSEQERTTELEELPGYVSSDEYIEKVAREKFGLVYKNETIFQAAE